MNRHEVSLSPWAAIALFFVALVASYAVGYYIGHATPPGAM